jgi:pilus assembly protein CpaB
MMMVIVVGLLVTAYFAKLMRAEEPRTPVLTQSQSVEFRNVPIAAATLEPGTLITAAQVGSSRVRTDSLLSDALLEERAAIGHSVKERIPAGSVIRWSQLHALPGDRQQLTAARGMRAVSIALRRTVAPINGLKEGQYLDVYLTPRADSSNAARLHGGVTLTLFRGVRLLAVTAGSSGNDAADVATLELTPDQAAILILARERGNIALSYNPEGKGDGTVALKNRDRATFDEILGLPPDPGATVGSTGTFTSEIFKGTARSTREFDERTKIDSSPATSLPASPSAVAPLWTRKSPASTLPSRPPERVSIAPVQTILR